ncbi:unnamed protein product [Albugo candida]|uniref:LisH domain-containing protein n=1 Tax=Albugo candida TaxID=65357 RepID=A0A024GEK0_9STRA|nr:unnamed protein product [Albugo candida]|eukprot:CCI44915.1 unnamed protein product [Albugo candida]
MCIYDFDNDEILFYIINFLRAYGFSRSASVLMEESGVDPFWMCGVSHEMTMLRDSVLAGKYDVALEFVQCLRGNLSGQEIESASRMVDNEKRMEYIHAVNVTKDIGEYQPMCERKRFDVLRAREELTDEAPLQYVECPGPIEEYSTQNSYAKARYSSAYSPYKRRLSCYERLVALFRPEITPSDAEYVYKMMPKLELACLVDEALEHRGSNDKASRIAASKSLRIAPINSLSLAMKATQEPPYTNVLDPRQPHSASTSLTHSQAWNSFAKPLKHHPLVMSIQFDSRWDDVDTMNENIDDVPMVGTADTSIQTVPWSLESVDAAIQTSMVKVHTATCQTENFSSDVILQTDLEPVIDTCDESMQTSWVDEHPVDVTIATYETATQMSPRNSYSGYNNIATQCDFNAALIEGNTQHDESNTCSQSPNKAETATNPIRDQEPLTLTYDRLGIDEIVQAHVVAQVKEAHAVRAMDISTARAEAMIGTNARTLRIFDLATIPLSRFGDYEEKKVLPLLPVILEKYRHHSLPIYSVAYNHFANDLWIASGSVDSPIRLVNLQKQDDIQISGHQGKVRCLAFARPHLLCGTASRDFVIRCWNFECQPQACYQRFDGHVGEIVAMQFPSPICQSTCSQSAISTHFLTASMDKTIRNWDFRTSKCTQLVASTRSVAYALSSNPQASQILASAHQDGSICLWDLRMARRALQSVLHHRDECRCISWSLDGNWLVSGSFDETVCLFSTSKTTPLLTPVASFRQHTGKVLQVQWNSHMPSFVTSGADHCVKLWTF